MKYQGKDVHNDYTHFVVIPRPDVDIVFKVKAVDATDYEKIDPSPEPPFSLRKGDSKMVKDYNDKDFKAAIDDWGKRKSAWIFIESIKESEVEWDTVTDDPSTFCNYTEELEAAGFSFTEVNAIINKVVMANGMSAEGINRATQDFLASMVETQND